MALTSYVHSAGFLLTARSLAPLAPGVAAALALGVSDVLAKVIIGAGCDVLTMLSFRSVIGLIFMAVWLRAGPEPSADARVRWISLGVGVLFALLIFCLFKAIEANDVPTAVLSYFVYPLLTGIAAAAVGLERLSVRGIACALVAFVGLAIMIGAHPEGLVVAGIAYALGAAVFRTGVLIVTRAFLVGADARLTTLYSVLAQVVIFVLISVVTRTWQPPQTGVGWTALIAMSLATTAGIFFVFVSTVRVGAFRTALIMNLEPVIAMVLSAVALGTMITPLQAVGSGIMLAALVAFQVLK
jgi:drug/metabolite transporter (DMT)-like permease